MIALLRKSGVALFVLALALIAQIPHAAHVFDRAPFIGLDVYPTMTWSAALLAYAYAIALESATLMFVVHGRQRASYGFALASFAVNLSYYAMHGVYLWTLGAFPAWLLSALLPIAIASYSHILTDAKDEKMQLPAWVVSAWSKINKRIVQPEVQPKPKKVAQTTAGSVQPIVQPASPIVQLDIIEDAQLDEDEQPDPQRLAAQLHSEGLSKAQIGERLGVHRNTVGKWLNGHSKVAV